MNKKQDPKQKDPKENKCVICGNEIYDMGHNPFPIKEEGRCCSDCNFMKVIPERMAGAMKENFNFEKMKELIAEHIPKSKPKIDDETIPQELRRIEEKWGVKAYNDFCKVLTRMQSKIDDLTKSRDNWKKKYMELKDEN